jgi:hypothetical protein
MAEEEDRYGALDDEGLWRPLGEEADRRRERLSIEQRAGQWIAETYLRDGLSSGRTVMLGAAGPDRRTAMRGLAEKFDTNRF